MKHTLVTQELSQQNLTLKTTNLQQSSLLALNIISNKIAKSMKSLKNDEFVKNCALKIGKPINENKIASEFEKISHSRRTRLIVDIDSKTMQTLMTNYVYFSIALELKTGIAFIRQLCVNWYAPFLYQNCLFGAPWAYVPCAIST